MRKTLARCKKCKYYDEEDDICEVDSVTFFQLRRTNPILNKRLAFFFCDEFEYDRDKDLDND